MRKIIRTKTKKILVAAAALVLCAAIVFGIFIYREHSLYFCQYAKPFAFSEVSGSENVALVAHRGLAVEAPENTLPAYEKAAEKGFRYVETDIRCTADGVWVLSHDASLKRMTGFSGKVEEMTLAEVQSHPIIKGGHVKEYEMLTTPTFEAFLALCKEKGLSPVVEVKTNPAECPGAPFESIIYLITRYGLENDAMIISFEYAALERIREYSAAIPMMLLIKKPDADVFTKVDKLGNCGIDCEYKAALNSPEFVTDALNSHISLGVWTVDKRKAAQQVCENGGIAFITTNAAMP